jgi:hypothetical protein
MRLPPISPIDRVAVPERGKYSISLPNLMTVANVGLVIVQHADGSVAQLCTGLVKIAPPCNGTPPPLWSLAEKEILHVSTGRPPWPYLAGNPHSERKCPPRPCSAPPVPSASAPPGSRSKIEVGGRRSFGLDDQTQSVSHGIQQSMRKTKAIKDSARRGFVEKRASQRAAIAYLRRGQAKTASLAIWVVGLLAPIKVGRFPPPPSQLSTPLRRHCHLTKRRPVMTAAYPAAQPPNLILTRW